MLEGGSGRGRGWGGSRNNVYLDQMPQLVAPNRGLTPRRKPTILSKPAIQIYLHVGMQRITSTQIRRRNLLRLIGPYTIRQEINNFHKITIRIHLRIVTQQIVHAQIRRCNLLRLIGAYIIRRKNTTFQQNNHPNLSSC